MATKKKRPTRRLNWYDRDGCVTDACLELISTTLGAESVTRCCAIYGSGGRCSGYIFLATFEAAVGLTCVKLSALAELASLLANVADIGIEAALTDSSNVRAYYVSLHTSRAFG